MDKMQIRTELLAAFSSLVSRIAETTGLKQSDVIAIVDTYFATDVESVDANNITKLVTPKGAHLMAEKVLSDWTALAPGALNQLEEIAQALNNDPDAFNTLKAATDGLRNDIRKFGLLGQIAMGSTDGQALLSTNWINYEGVANGVYLITGDGSAIGNSGGLDITPTMSTEYYVSIRPYSLTPVPGEENRKVIRSEARQGSKVVYREVDSRVAAGQQTDWATISGGGGSADQVSETDFGTWYSYSLTELRALTTGARIGYGTGTGVLAWLGYSDLDAAADYTSARVAVNAVVSVDPVAPGENIITLVTTGPLGSVISTIKTAAGATPVKTIISTMDYVDDSVEALSGIISQVADLLGYAEGQIVATVDGSTHARTGLAGQSSQTTQLTFNADGSFVVTGGVGGAKVGYWMPYGTKFSSGDYQVKVVHSAVTGNTGGTVGSTYAAIAGKTLTIQGTAFGMAATTTATLTIKHVPTNTETVATVILRMTVAAA